MKVIVDRKLCENHGQCAIAAPDVFRMNAEGILEYEEEVSDSLLSDVEDAMDACPLQAILIQGQP